MDSLFKKNWNAQDIKRWKSYVLAGKHHFIWKYGYTRFFPVVFSGNLLGSYLLYGAANSDFGRAVVMQFCILAIGSYFFGWHLWNDLEKSYQSHQNVKNG